MVAYGEARSLEVPGMIAGAHLPDTTPEPSTWCEIREGYRTKTIKRGNFTIVIHRPILSDKEREKRERIVETALSNYAKENHT